MHAAVHPLRHTALKFTAAAFLAAVIPSLANAGQADVSWSISIGSSYPSPVYGQPAPVYVQPAPVYVHPHPVYVQPRQVYVQPSPVYVQPGSVIQVGSPMYVYEHRHRKAKQHHWGHRRDHREHSGHHH